MQRQHFSRPVKFLALAASVATVFFNLGFLNLKSSAADPQTLSQASSSYSWSFPADHGSHTKYQTEWWYYTGQLYAKDARPFQDKPRYGFQLTFFRRADPKSGGAKSEYMAHATITDIAGQKTHFSSRLGGGDLGLARVDSHSLSAASGDWSVEQIGERLAIRLSAPLHDSAALTSLALISETLPDRWFHGVNGFSQKASCATCASMYYSLPRIAVTAKLGLGASAQELRGVAWMDHEFMTNSLSQTQTGWDWLGIMLRDGRNLMVFRLRDNKGETDFASGTILSVAEGSKALKGDQFSLKPIEYWTSAKTNARYPVVWRLIVESEGIDLVLKARVPDSEIGHTASDLSVNKGAERIVYWEGPVASSDESALGYLEMTGYQAPIAGFSGN